MRLYKSLKKFREPRPNYIKSEFYVVAFSHSYIKSNFPSCMLKRWNESTGKIKHSQLNERKEREIVTANE